MSINHLFFQIKTTQPPNSPDTTAGESIRTTFKNIYSGPMGAKSEEDVQEEHFIDADDSTTRATPRRCPLPPLRVHAIISGSPPTNNARIFIVATALLMEAAK